MKKLLLITLILLPCNLGAQEGCGEWVKIKDQIRPPSHMNSFAFWIDGKIEIFDSVWILKPLEDCADSVDIDVLQGDTWPIPDTTYTQADAVLEGVQDSVILRQMTIEEKVDMLFDMVRSLTAEVNYLKSKRVILDRRD